MSAQIRFFGLQGIAQINDLAGSGLGFYGSTFGSSVKVGFFQDSTFITNANGTAQGPAVNNCKFISPTGVSCGTAAGATVPMRQPWNIRATLNIRFTNDTPVNVQNVKLRIYDRTVIDNGPSGVNCYVYEVIKPSSVDPSETSANGFGTTGWAGPVAGSSVIVTLSNSPMSGGLGATGTPGPDVQHDWYTMLSATPLSIGSKDLFGLYISLEYL